MEMTTAQVAAAIPGALLVEVVGDASTAVVDLTHDSRQVAPGWAFAAVRGERADGHRFASTAVAAGASLLIVDHRLEFDVAQIVVRDVRIALGHAAAAVHGRPSDRLRMVGITGTNGKTTTTHLLASILRTAGMEAREVGTLSGVRTTPEAPDLQRRLAGFVADGVDAVVMEVSSHALALHRVTGTRFDAVVFTNLGRDHLDLHESMEAYFRAKASLFTPELAAMGLTNVDDPYGRLLLDVAAIPVEGFSLGDASDVDVDVGHHEFTWRGRRVHVPIGGGFNVMNSLAALSVAERLGVDPDLAVAGLRSSGSIPGRFELVSTVADDISVIVDYAHTPDGLVELLESARRVAGSGRVIVVFGCGGDRDADKRPLMGAAAATHADLVVVTSDNPRHEDPEAIIRSAVAGIEQRYRGSVMTDVDRRTALDRAIHLARPGDVVLVAGKGHETTQTIGDRAFPFDDRVVVRELLARRGAQVQP